MEQTIVETVPLEETKGLPSDPRIEDQAASDYSNLMPLFKKKMKELSEGKVRRVLLALMEYPFENTKPHFSYPAEMELFKLGLNIQDCRFVLKKAVFEMSADEIRAELAKQTHKEGTNNEPTMDQSRNDSEEEGRSRNLPETGSSQGNREANQA